MPTKVNGKEYYTPKDVCEILNISRTTLLKWEKDGLLKSIKLPNKRKIFKIEEVKKLKEKLFKDLDL